MMPFSVLRIWGLGLISWTILGFGLYFAWESYKAFGRPAETRIADTRTAQEPAERPDRTVHADRQPPANDDRAWQYLIASIALLGFSFGGFLPVRLLLSMGGATHTAERVQPTREFQIARPDGARLHLELYGDEKRPTLLLTHGSSLDASAWDYVKGRLAARFRIVTWDLRGHGRSQGATTGDYSIETMAADLDAVIGETIADQPIVLVGHSLGGMIVQTHRRLFPSRWNSSIYGAVLLFTTYTNPLRTALANPLLTAIEWPIITPLNYLTIALAPVAWLSNLQSYLNGSLHVSTRLASFSGKQSSEQLDHAARLQVRAWPGVVAKSLLAMQRFDEQRTLPEIQQPVLVISGSHDRMTLPSASQHIEQQLPNDRPYRLQTGHLGHWEAPDEFVRVVTEFASMSAAKSMVNDAPAVDRKVKHST